MTIFYRYVCRSAFEKDASWVDTSGHWRHWAMLVTILQIETYLEGCWWYKTLWETAPSEKKTRSFLRKNKLPTQMFESKKRPKPSFRSIESKFKQFATSILLFYLISDSLSCNEVFRTCLAMRWLIELLLTVVIKINGPSLSLK